MPDPRSIFPLLALQPSQIASVAIAAVFALLGVLAVAAVRRGAATSRVHIRLAGVGRISDVSVMVFGLTCLGLAYHLVVHAMGWTQFRAPLGVAIGVGGLAVIGSLLVDAIENRRLNEPDETHHPNDQ